MDVGTMLDQIIGYEDVTKKFKFNRCNFGGIKAWSIHFINEEAKLKLDVRNSEWTIYDWTDKELIVNHSPASLDMYLSRELAEV